MKELRQRKNFVTREYRISDSKLFYNISRYGQENEVDIPFENINGEKVSHKFSNNIFILLSALIYFVGFGAVIGHLRGGEAELLTGILIVVFATIVLSLYWFTREDFWKIKISDNNYIQIHKEIPNKSVTDQFISDLMDSRNEFLRENYSIIDENLDYENQLYNFRWLKSINAISKEEFDQKYAELKRTVKPDKKNIGFGN